MAQFKLADWVVDYTYRLRGSVQMYLRHRPPAHYLGYTKNNKVPVLLLAGLSEKWGFLRHLGNAVSWDGHPVYVVPKLGHNFIDVPKSAKLVREVIEENDLNQVIIVGHSKGGLIGKYLLAHYNQDRRIKGLIAVATPFSGTRLAKAVPHRSFKELTAESRVVLDLAAHAQDNAKITSIMPQYDNHIWHTSGSYLEGATNLTIKVRGHHKVLFGEDVEATILDQINKLGQ